MKLHVLKYLSVLAEELHFGRAAQRLSITQSPLSLAIKALEDELGVLLLVRNRRTVRLTPAGVAFVDEARQILDRVERAALVARVVDSGMTGRLDIGMSPALIFRDVLPIVDQFNASDPGVEIVLHEMQLSEQQSCLERGQLHAGFAHGKVAPHLKAISLPPDKFVLCVPKNHPMADRSVVDLREMGSDRFVMFSRQNGLATEHDQIIGLLDRAGIHPRTVHMARTWLAMMAMVSQDRGVALVPGSLANAGMAHVRLIPLLGRPVAVAASLMWNPALVAPTLEKFLESAARTLSRTKRAPASKSELALRRRIP
ncbi:MAG TPA: LysR family transcriptional regulator [Ramlibacter sp.]|nr:LysR family transcriptional regulator [Ramlibacter sp.]